MPALLCVCGKGRDGGRELGSVRAWGSTALPWVDRGAGQAGSSVGLGPSGHGVGRHRAPQPVPAWPSPRALLALLPPGAGPWAGCPPCLFGDWVQMHCSVRVFGARSRL